MITEDFIALKDFLLDKNRFFDQGLANVYLDEITGLIYQGDGSEKFAVGIDDQFGNYFYIRTDADIRYSQSRPQVTDSSMALDETVKCYLVAVVDQARPKELVQCLLNSIVRYGNERIRPIRALYIREIAVAKELARLPKEDIQYALQNLAERQVVVLEFDFTTKFTARADGCPCDPICKTCNDE
jgi:hypothetical protein